MAGSGNSSATGGLQLGGGGGGEGNSGIYIQSIPTPSSTVISPRGGAQMLGLLSAAPNAQQQLSGAASTSNTANTTTTGATTARAVGESQRRLRTELLARRNTDLERELRAKEKVLVRVEQQSQFLAQRVSEFEEKYVLLQEKYKDRTSLETLRGKMLENAKHQLRQAKQANEAKESKLQELSRQLQAMLDKERGEDRCICCFSLRVETWLFIAIYKEISIFLCYLIMVQK